MILLNVHAHHFNFEQEINHYCFECLAQEYLEMILICYNWNISLIVSHQEAEWHSYAFEKNISHRLAHFQ